MENNSSEVLDNDLLYNDNYINNYEELACCNNMIISNFLQNNKNNIINSISSCFKNVSLDEEDQLINNSEQKLITPLCSNNKNCNNNNIFVNNIDNNNNNINNNINSNNNENIEHIPNNSLLSEVNNPNNESAAEPIMSIKKYNTLINNSKKRKRNKLHRKRQNFFNIIKDVFKDFFTENDDEEEQNNDNNLDSQIKLNLKHRPILQKIIEREIISPFQLNQNNPRNNTILRHANTHINRRPELFSDDIVSYNNYQENDDESFKILVSYIPVFTFEEKNKTNEDNNKCTICLSDFEIGDKNSILPCLHNFHSYCIEKWIKSKKFCPICKFQISLESLKNNFEQNNK